MRVPGQVYYSRGVAGVRKECCGLLYDARLLTTDERCQSEEILVTYQAGR